MNRRRVAVISKLVSKLCHTVINYLLLESYTYIVIARYIAHALLQGPKISTSLIFFIKIRTHQEHKTYCSKSSYVFSPNR